MKREPIDPEPETDVAEAGDDVDESDGTEIVTDSKLVGGES